jgi:predicted glutamine amidotransferase
MCGIAGFIGHAKKPKTSFELMTALFKHLESRGVDASGFWATEESFEDEKGAVVYHKEPVKSSQFVGHPQWQNIKKFQIDMLIAHARATSNNGGHPSINMNNHPFVSSDKSIAMVHNGNLDEAGFLKQCFQTISDTDSELLLRIYEQGLDRDDFHGISGVPDKIARKMSGIKDIWSYISKGAMAVAIAERIDDHTRGLWLFRNEKRPLWLADFRKSLGQVFFFSSPDVWYETLESNEELKKICWGSQKIIELPPYQVWYLEIDNNHPTVSQDRFFKMQVQATETNTEFQPIPYREIKPGNPAFPVIPNVEQESPKSKILPISNVICKPHCEDEERLVRKSKKVLSYGSKFDDPVYDDENNYYPKNNHEAICDSIKELTERISVDTTNLSLEGSVTPSDYELMIESLEQIKCDLEGTLRLLGRS